MRFGSLVYFSLFYPLVSGNSRLNICYFEEFDNGNWYR